MANGFTTCPGKDALTYQKEILAELQARNVNQVPINAICIGAPGSVDEAFMKQVAADNGGSFVRIIP